jgi:hypothetical protein
MNKNLTLYLFLTIFFSCSQKEKVAKPSIIDSNIYAVFENGTQKQLTFNNSDSDPILLKDQDIIIFTRSESNVAFDYKKLMKVNVHDLSETVITDQKPFGDGLDGSHYIFNLNSPRLSLDKKYVLFTTEKYATGNLLVKVNINTGVWTELFTAETFEELSKEPYTGYFLVGQSVIEAHGRDIYYRLVNDSGQIIKKFSNEESMLQFRSKIK